MDAVRVRAEIRLGEVEANRLARSAAIAHFERALNFIRDGHLKGPEVESWRAAAIRGEGMSQEDDAKAQALFAQAGTLIHELTDRQPENPRWQGLAAELDYRQGFAFYRLSGNGNSAVSYTLDDAQRLLEQSRKVDQELCDRDPDNLDWCVGLIFASRGLALVHNGLGAPHVSAELEAALNDAKKISSRQPAWLRASLIKILASEDLSDMKAKADSAGALALLTEACQDSRKLVNETSDLLAYRALAACIAQRGEILRTSKKQDEALRSYEQALASLKPIALRIEDDSDFQFDRARYYADIGDAQSELKHAAEAKAAYDTEVSIWAAEVKRNPRPLSYYKLSIADCESGDAYRDDKETAKAINRYDNAAEAIRMAAKAAPTDVNILRQQEFVDGRMSDLWFVQGDLKRSLDMLEKAVEVLWTALRYDPSNETLDKDLTYYRARTDKLDAAVRKDDPSADSEGKQPTKAGDAVLLARIKDLRAKTASQLDSQPSWRVRPLTAGAWRTLPPADPESKLARQHVSQWDPQVKAADILGVRKLVLHFWDDAALYEAEVLLPDGTQGAVDYVQCGDETVLLSGLSQPIHDLNKTHPLKLDTAERAMAYLRFFTGSIQAEDGRFILVDLPEEVRWRTEAAADVQRDTEAKVSPLVVEKTPNGPWQAIGTVQYSDALFVARFRIQRDGDVAMSNDRPVAQDLPVSVDYFHGGIRTTRTLDEARLVIATDQLKADPENEKTLQRLPELQSHLKHWKDAVAAERNWMAFLEKKEKDTPERRAKLLEAYGDLTRYQVRGSDFSGALATAETGLKLDPENEDLVRQLPALHFNLKHWKEAVAAQQNWVSFIERKEKDPAKRRDKLLGAYLNLSWYQLFARDFSGALASSEAGLRLDASDLLLETNHAHALLFLGRTRDAEELYQKYRGHKRSADSSETWEQLINNDFDALEKEGLTPPEEAHIRKLLGTDRITEKK